MTIDLILQECNPLHHVIVSIDMPHLRLRVDLIHIACTKQVQLPQPLLTKLKLPTSQLLLIHMVLPALAIGEDTCPVRDSIGIGCDLVKHQMLPLKFDRFKVPVWGGQSVLGLWQR
jgi:hypothetical protein